MKLDVLALRTPTLPPATHTNCYRLGDTVIDPASPWPDEQERLAAWAGPIRRILLTHHHHDHVGGVADLARRTGARVAAHPESRLDVPIDEPVLDGDLLDTGAGTLRALYTPGHADGHLAFVVDEGDEVIVGDLVAGIGTIVLVPPEGHLRTYLASLARVQAIARVVHPAHGPALPGSILAQYAVHRAMRTGQVRTALGRLGPATPAELAAEVYAGLPGVDLTLAALQVRAHLTWLEEESEGAWIGERFHFHG